MANAGHPGYCPACGTAVRPAAAFCPQCGQPLTRSAPLPNPALDRTLGINEPLPPPAPRLDRTLGINEPLPPPAPPEKVSEPVPPGPARYPNQPEAKQPVSAVAPAGIHRATTAARAAIQENVRPRVEKLRQVSSVVIDEATYDPTVRFVLVALALFLISLVIAFLSKVMG
jgi:zinc-ribbon domain